MKKFNSIKKNEEFRYIYKNGKSYANKYLVMYVTDSNTLDNRIGISVSKKVGNSVIRHRITRLIREIFRLNNSLIDNKKNIIVVARAGAKDKSYKELESAYIHLCKMHGIIRKDDENESCQ